MLGLGRRRWHSKKGRIVSLWSYFDWRLRSSASLALASSSVSARQVSISRTACSLVMSPPVRARIWAFMAVRRISPMFGEEPRRLVGSEGMGWRK